MLGEKILLLDTEKNVLFAYQTLLEEEGYQVEIASSENEVLEKLSSQRFAILITEFYLKGKNTINLVKYIKQYYPEIYIIMITATLLDSDTYAEIIDAGVDDYFTNPFSSSGLLVNIKKGLRRIAQVIRNNQLDQRVKRMEHLLSSHPYFSKEHKVICNNLYFHKRLRNEIVRSERYKNEFSLLLFELNLLDNEQKHLEAEKKRNISKQVFQLLLKNTRKSDVITQYNGNFALILIGTSSDGSKNIARRIQDQISNTPILKEKIPYYRIDKDLIFNHLSYPEHSEAMYKWVNEEEKKWNKLFREYQRNV